MEMRVVRLRTRTRERDGAEDEDEDGDDDGNGPSSSTIVFSYSSSSASSSFFVSSFSVFSSLDFCAFRPLSFRFSYYVFFFPLIHYRPSRNRATCSSSCSRQRQEVQKGRGGKGEKYCIRRSSPQEPQQSNSQRE